MRNNTDTVGFRLYVQLLFILKTKENTFKRIKTRDMISMRFLY